MNHAACVRTATLNLVCSIDLRPFAASPSEFTLVSSNITATEAVQLLRSTFPRLTCILLDGHPDIQLESVVGDQLIARRTESPLLLSISRCRTKLPFSFYDSIYWRQLVYLDLSDLLGSLGYGFFLYMTINPDNFPRLRILKLQGREMDSSSTNMLFKIFKKQLWSIDLSRNKVSDGICRDIHLSFRELMLMGGDFAVEGRRLVTPALQNISFGQFCFVEESMWSATFSHPHRYLVDAPLYSQGSQENLQFAEDNARLDGRVPIRSDSVDAVKAVFSSGPGCHRPSPEVIHELDICRGHGGITHLYLNENNLSATALGTIIRPSRQLQRFECDSMSIKIPEAARLPSFLRKASLSGILGLAHVFRPIISANLQVLRIHHSLVTQLPCLEAENMPTLAAWWLAETHLLPRAELAYPEAFVPDMNPRLQSLTLTHIPRYSTGPLTDKLVKFLKLASLQERAIQDFKAEAVTNRHNPLTLLGLRHIRLEFRHDPRGELAVDYEDEGNFGLAELVDASKRFSFFGDCGWTRSSSGTAQPSTVGERHPVVDNPHNAPERSGLESGRPNHALDTETETETETVTHEYRTCSWTWRGEIMSAPVWIGSTYHQQHSLAVREYMRLLRADPGLCARLEPASPNHVLAGVPYGKYIFAAAWDAILVPPTTTGRGHDVRRPTRVELLGMRDVVADLKAFRARSRDAYRGVCESGAGRTNWEPPLGRPHYHWSGKLEVLMEDTTAHYQQSKYWR